MSFCGTCGSKDPLEIHAGHNILELGVVVGLKAGRIKCLKAWRKYNGTHFEVDNCFRLLKIDGIVFTVFLTKLELAFPSRINRQEVEAIVSVNGVLERHCLRKRYVNSLALTHAKIEFIGDLLRAFGCANTASHALLFINIARGLDNPDLKISLLSADAVYLS